MNIIENYYKSFREGLFSVVGMTISLIKNPDFPASLLEPFKLFNRNFFWFLFGGEDYSGVFNNLKSMKPFSLLNMSSLENITAATVSLCNSTILAPILESFEEKPVVSEGLSSYSKTILSSFLITLIPCLLILLISGIYKIFKQKDRDSAGKNLFIPPEWKDLCLNVMMAFASGSLLADVFFHIIPRVYLMSQGSPAISIMVGIMFFWSMELISFWFEKTGSHRGRSKNVDASLSKKKRSKSKSKNEVEITTPVVGGRKSSRFTILFVISDLIHNFTDGLAISSAWVSSASSSIFSSLGWTTCVAIVLHEIPHELGDIAALMRLGGFTFTQALTTQFITSFIGSMSGALTGLLIFSCSDIFIFKGLSENILAFSAGGFIYMALSMILPRLTNSSERGGGENFSDEHLSSVLYLMCFLAGMTIINLV